MKLILAQGNPGPEYTSTRHNVGFLALDFFADQKKAEFKNKPKFYADIAELSETDEKILLVKPTTFYNETGKSARALADFYKIDTSDILVLHDELALPFGTLRSREKGSDAGNNGIKSLNTHLGEQYARLRIGTWSEHHDQIGSFDFVLSKFTEDERSRLRVDIFPKIAELIDHFTHGRYTSTSHKV